MVKYFALWIPTLKIGDITLTAPPGVRRIQDNGMWLPYFLWGEVDRHLNFTLWYSQTEDRATAASLVFTPVCHNREWFIVYRVELPDTDTEDDFKNLLIHKGLIVPLYHYIKDHFHQHIHHDSQEDGLLQCLTSDTPLSLNNAHDQQLIADHYLDLYAKKIANFLNDAKGFHERARVLVDNVRTTSMGISLCADTIRSGRVLSGEYEYCEFLMRHHTTNRSEKNKKIREDMKDVRHELEAISFDYQLCMNAFSIKLAVYGILAGVAGILISSIGIVQSSMSSNEVNISPILQRIDSVSDAQSQSFVRIDSVQKSIAEKQEIQDEKIEQVIKKLEKLNMPKTQNRR